MDGVSTYLRNRWRHNPLFLEYARYGLQELPALQDALLNADVRPQLDMVLAIAASSRNLRLTQGPQYRQRIKRAPLADALLGSLDAPMRNRHGELLAATGREWADLPRPGVWLPHSVRFDHTRYNSECSGEEYIRERIANLPETAAQSLRHELQLLPHHYCSGKSGEPVYVRSVLVAITEHDADLPDIVLPHERSRVNNLHLARLAQMLDRYRRAA